jgi:hypothetical protein
MGVPLPRGNRDEAVDRLHTFGQFRYDSRSPIEQARDS